MLSFVRLKTDEVSRSSILDRQFAHANAGGVISRRRDRGSDAGQTDLADAARANVR